MAPKLESWVLDASHTWVDAIVWGIDHVVAQAQDGMLAAWRITERGNISVLWRLPATGSPGQWCLDERAETLIVATRVGGGTSLRGVSVASGDTVWEARVDGEAQTLFEAEDETWVFFEEQAAVFSGGTLTLELGIDVAGTWARRRGGTIDVWAPDRYVCLSPPPSVHWLAKKRLGDAVDSVAFGEEYTAARQSGGKTLRLFRRFDPVWGQTVQGAGRIGDVRLDESGDRLYASLSTGEVVCWELSSGEVIWQAGSEESAVELHTPLAPVLIDTFVVAPMRSGRIVILDRESGRVLGESAETEHRFVAPMGANRLVTTGSSLRVYRLS